MQNQRFWLQKKNSKCVDIFDSDQIEGAEFEFLGLEMRFEKNEKHQFLKFDFDSWII